MSSKRLFVLLFLVTVGSTSSIANEVFSEIAKNLTVGVNLLGSIKSARGSLNVRRTFDKIKGVLQSTDAFDRAVNALAAIDDLCHTEKDVPEEVNTAASNLQKTLEKTENFLREELLGHPNGPGGRADTHFVRFDLLLRKDAKQRMSTAKDKCERFQRLSPARVNSRYWVDGKTYELSLLYAEHNSSRLNAQILNIFGTAAISAFQEIVCLHHFGYETKQRNGIVAPEGKTYLDNIQELLDYHEKAFKAMRTRFNKAASKSLENYMNENHERSDEEIVNGVYELMVKEFNFFGDTIFASAFEKFEKLAGIKSYEYILNDTWSVVSEKTKKVAFVGTLDSSDRWSDYDAIVKKCVTNMEAFNKKVQENEGYKYLDKIINNATVTQVKKCLEDNEDAKNGKRKVRAIMAVETSKNHGETMVEVVWEKSPFNQLGMIYTIDSKYSTWFTPYYYKIAVIVIPGGF